MVGAPSRSVGRRVGEPIARPRLSDEAALVVGTMNVGGKSVRMSQPLGAN
jgi:hypothetical protein